MNLGSVLHASGMVRNAYTSLNQRVPLRFMARRLLPGAGLYRFTLAHALALNAVRKLMDEGMLGSRAVNVIDASFDFIDDARHEIAAGRREGWWISVETMLDGNCGWSAGERDTPPLRTSPVVSKVAVNLVVVYDEIAARLTAPSGESAGRATMSVL